MLTGNKLQDNVLIYGLNEIYKFFKLPEEQIHKNKLNFSYDEIIYGKKKTIKMTYFYTVNSSLDILVTQESIQGIIITGDISVKTRE